MPKNRSISTSHNCILIQHKEKTALQQSVVVYPFVVVVFLCMNVLIHARVQIRPGFLLQGPPHKCALFFVDNSGVDIILGVMPFVRELLSRGTEVRNVAVQFQQ